MLKKLDFNMITINCCKPECFKKRYSDLIIDYCSYFFLYSFNFSTPCFIYLINYKGEAYLHDSLLMSDIDNYDNLTKIDNSFFKLLNVLKELIVSNSDYIFTNEEECFITIYITQDVINYVDVEYSKMCIKSSIQELEKMERDINWFGNDLE